MKTFRAFSTLILLPALAASQSSVSLTSTPSSTPGTTSFTLSVNSPAGSEPAGVQWTVTYPSPSIASLAVTASPALTAAGKTITCNGGPAAYTCIAAGLCESIIPSGALATVTGTLVPAATSGPVTLPSTVATTPSGTTVTTTNTNPDPESVVVTPATATMSPSQSLPFAATVTGSSLGVVWGLSPAVGSMTSAGVYRAPAVLTSTETVTVTATLSDGSAAGSATVTIDPAAVAVSSVTASPTSVTGGSSVSVTINLSAPAPSGGAAVTLTSSSPAFPTTTVTIPSGATSQSFSLPTTAVSTVTTATITASYDSTSASSTLTLRPPSTAAVSFVQTDTTTEGSWKGVYGADGSNVIADSVNYPAYVSVSPSGNTPYVWASPTSDLRALQQGSSSGRIAACWYNTTSFNVDVTITDSVTHQIALYFLDWDSSVRALRVDVLDPSGTLLDTRSVSNFHTGQYLVWNISSHVSFRITNTAYAGNAVLSGIFFSTPGQTAAAPPTDSVVVTPAVASLSPSQSLPFAATVTGSSLGVVWGLSPAVGSITSAGVYTAPAVLTSTETVTVTATLSDGSAAGSATVTIDPAAVAVSSVTASPTSVTGGGSVSVTINLSAPAPSGGAAVTLTGSSPAFPTTTVTIASGATSQSFSLPTTAVSTVTTATITASYASTSASTPLTLRPPSTAAVSFVQTDTTTEGSWKGVYGADGFNVIADSVNYPAYVSVSPSGNTPYVWASPTSDLRALQQGSSSGRIAACWYNTTSFNVDVTITDSVTHQIALYFLDWDSSVRALRVDVLDPSGTLLDTRSVSNFHTGQYLVWNISSHVSFRITNTAYAGNAVLSGIFFSTPGQTPTAPLTDLAEGKTATQSSTLTGFPYGAAALAADRNTDGNYWDSSVSHTNADTNAWWQVDLGAAANISSIAVWNRTDCCAQRLSDYWVFVSNTPFAATDTPATLQNRAGTWSNHQTTVPSPSVTLPVGMQGRYVRIQLNDTDFLALAEVQVFGTVASAPPPNDLAQGKTATQSSTLAGYPYGAAALAVDGNTDGNSLDGSVSHTNADTNAWWQVDLGTAANISSIVVWNRTDCCAQRLSDYWIFVSNTPFAATDTPATLQNRAGTWSNHQTSVPSPSVTIPVGAQGRYVRIQLNDADFLALAEVQVFGQ